MDDIEIYKNNNKNIISLELTQNVPCLGNRIRWMDKTIKEKNVPLYFFLHINPCTALLKY
jgi:hypothetical protein